MDHVNLGWVAGIIDGEGSVELGKRTMWRRPEVSVASADKEMIDLLKILCGGSVSAVTSRNGYYTEQQQQRKQEFERIFFALEGKPAKRWHCLENSWDRKVCGAGPLPSSKLGWIAGNQYASPTGRTYRVS